MRSQGGGEEFVTSHGFIRCDAAERATEFSGPLGQERGPRLQDAIRKAGLENSARDGLKCRLEAQVSALPELFFPALERPQCLWLFRAELHPALGSQAPQ